MIKIQLESIHLHMGNKSSPMKKNSKITITKMHVDQPQIGQFKQSC